MAPALEKMTQLTSLDLSCARIRFRRGLGGLGLMSLVRAVGYELGCDVLCLGCALQGRAMRPTVCELCAEGQ